MLSLREQSGVLSEEGVAVEKAHKVGAAKADSQGEGELVPC
jgi:hypothetical protein